MPLRAPKLSIHDVVTPKRHGVVTPRANPAAPRPALTHAWWSSANAEQLVRLAARVGAPQSMLVHAACACARVVLPLTLRRDRDACAYAIDCAERWIRGEATQEECENAYLEAGVRAPEAPEARGARWAVSAAAGAAETAADPSDWMQIESSAWVAYSAEMAAKSAGQDPRFVHDAARAVLTLEVLRSLAKNHASAMVVEALSGGDIEEAAYVADRIKAGELRSLVEAIEEVLSAEPKRPLEERKAENDDMWRERRVREILEAVT